jgi:hypothetical protein
VGVLLGTAAARRASMDTTVSKMLCLHVPALLPPGFGDLEIPSLVQTAALVGIGLLYQGTAHRLMTEVLLSEVGRKPTSDKVQDREGYSLAAGLALGLVTLGRGSDAVGLQDLQVRITSNSLHSCPHPPPTSTSPHIPLQIENRLGQLMIGGRDPEASEVTFHTFSLTSCSSSCTLRFSLSSLPPLPLYLHPPTNFILTPGWRGEPICQQQVFDHQGRRENQCGRHLPWCHLGSRAHVH